jgi:hypothetical protein
MKQQHENKIVEPKSEFEATSTDDVLDKMIAR